MIWSYKKYKENQNRKQEEEDLRIAIKESKRKIRIEDYDDEICVTINGIKAIHLSDNGISILKELREDYVRKQLNKN